MAFVVRFKDSGAHFGRMAILVAENDLRSHPRPFPGTEHDPPIVGRVLLEQQDFKPPVRVRIHAAEASGDYA